MQAQHLPRLADSFQLFLTQMGQVPLLKADEERRLAREVESASAELRRAVLGSPVTMRQIVLWDELIASGEMDAKELLPRGRPSPARRVVVRREIHEIAQAVRGGQRSQKRQRARGGPHPRRAALHRALGKRYEGIGRRIGGLGLHPDRIARLANKIKEQARRAREGKVLDPLPMPADELIALGERVHALEDRLETAKVGLLKANLRLVVSIARGYAQHHNVELSDLIQEGSLGLMRAIEKFKPARGFRFSTYATWWIRQAVSRAAMEQERTVRVPAHVQERMAKLRRAGQAYLQESGQNAQIDDYARLTRLSSKKVKDAIEAMQDTVSLGLPVGEEQEQSLEDMLEDRGGQSAHGPTEAHFRTDEVRRWLDTLSEREAGVLKLRFGIGEPEPTSLDEVGRRFHITRERARQIQVQAIRKLKNSPWSESMREYLA